MTYIRKDGSRFPAAVSVTALRDAQDAIVGYLLIGTDMTARKAEAAGHRAGGAVHPLVGDLAGPSARCASNADQLSNSRPAIALWLT